MQLDYNNFILLHKSTGINQCTSFYELIEVMEYENSTHIFPLKPYTIKMSQFDYKDLVLEKFISHYRMDKSDIKLLYKLDGVYGWVQWVNISGMNNTTNWIFAEDPSLENKLKDLVMKTFVH